MLIDYKVTGMTCAACSARVEKVTGQIPGVNKAEVNLLAGTMRIDADSESVTELVVKAVSDAGYGIDLPSNKKNQKVAGNEELLNMKRRIVVSAIFLGVLMYFTMGHMVGIPMPHWYHGIENAMVAALLQFFLTLPVVYLNRVYYSKGLKALWHRAPNMDSLIAVGSGAALLYGIVALFRMAYAAGHNDISGVEFYSNNLYFESAAMILTLITFGKFLETRAKGKTGDAIQQLMDLSPKMATVKVNGEAVELPIEDVQAGDVVIVRSGGRIPVDGIVIAGRASVDQSALTGESVPIEVSEGSAVSASSINTAGYLELRAERVGEDTILSQVIRLVEDAGGSKAPIARLADKIAGVFVPVVMSIALITFVVWLVLGEGFEFSLTTAIAVLVISCPCALGLATPVAIMVGTGRGAQMGVLFKNAEVLENLHRVDTVVLDKTGTLTRGKPAVTDVITVHASKDELISIAVSLESRSEHPFAKAILREFSDYHCIDPENFETLPGRGVCGICNGTKYYGGNRQLMEDLGTSVPEYTEFTNQGKTPLYFADEHKKFLGAIVAADILKDDSKIAVAALRNLGLDVIMLTGDNYATSMNIAAKAGIETVIANVLPGDKAGVVEDLKKKGCNVLMVGDGINDAPALVTADVGMAVGAGTDIAMESANVVLMNNSLIGVSQAIELSKATIRNIEQNLFWAFFYNSLGIPIAAGLLYPAFGIQLSPMLGAAAMSMSSVFVVTNALRLRLFTPKSKNDTIHKVEEKFSVEVKKMDTIVKVEGMMCVHCKARVEQVCKAVDGVVDAVVNLEEKQVTVKGEASVAALEKAITDAGYEVIHS